MSSLANPNWLAVAAALFVMCGSVLLAKAFIQGNTTSSDADARQRADAYRQVSARFGLPMLGIGVFLHAVGQMTTSTLTPLLASAVLGLAFVMLLYACLEETMIDSLVGEKEVVKKAPRLALLPPAQAPEVRETMMEPMVAEAAR